MSCLQILTLTTTIKSPPAGWLPIHSGIWVGWTMVHAHTEKRAKQGNHSGGTATPGSKHNHLPKDINATSLLVKQFLRGHGCQWAAHGQPAQYHRRCHLDCRTSILCDSYVTSVLHASLHLVTLIDTCSKTEHVNRWGKGEAGWLYKQGCQVDMLHYSRGSKSFTMHVPRINRKIHRQRNCWHVLHSHAWLRMAPCVKGRSHLALINKWGAKSTHIWWSRFAVIPTSEEKQPNTDNIISLKTSLSVHYLQRMRDNSANAGNWISESILCILTAIYKFIICRTVVSPSMFLLTVNNTTAVPFRQRGSLLWIPSSASSGKLAQTWL